MKTQAFLCLALIGLSLMPLAEAATLQEKHPSCQACHPKDAGTPPSTGECLACHGSYGALAEKTRAVKPNPHDSHMGALRCTICHRGHQPARVFCNDCHTFKSLQLN